MNLPIADFPLPVLPGDTNERPRSDYESELLTRLRDWFRTDFELFDGTSGDLVCGDLRRGGDPWVQGQLCRACSQRGTIELLDDDEPLLALAIPVKCGGKKVVAVGMF